MHFHFFWWIWIPVIFRWDPITAVSSNFCTNHDLKNPLPSFYCIFILRFGASYKGLKECEALGGLRCWQRWALGSQHPVSPGNDSQINPSRWVIALVTQVGQGRIPKLRLCCYLMTSLLANLVSEQDRNNRIVSLAITLYMTENYLDLGLNLGAEKNKTDHLREILLTPNHSF